MKKLFPSVYFMFSVFGGLFAWLLLNIPLVIILLLLIYLVIPWQVKWADGKKFEDKFVDTLKKYGYKGAYMSKEWLKQPIFIQSFAPTSLVYISNKTDSPKIFLIDDVDILTEDTNQVCTRHCSLTVDWFSFFLYFLLYFLLNFTWVFFLKRIYKF